MATRRMASGTGEALVPQAPSLSEGEALDGLVASLSSLNMDQLRLQWRNHLGGIAPAHLPGWLLMRVLAYRIRRGERIDHFETVRQRKNGSLIIVSLTVSPVRSASGEIVGASKIARDVSEAKRTQERLATLAREAEHRSKNLLANVLATVKLSKSDTLEGLKQAIEGRIQALANVHSLFIQTRWIGAELSTIARQELAPYEKGEARANPRSTSLVGAQRRPIHCCYPT